MATDPQALRDRLTQAERRDQLAIECYDQALAEIAEAVDRIETWRDNIAQHIRLRREAAAGKAAPEVWEWVYEPGDHVTAVRCSPHGEGECSGHEWSRVDGRWQADGEAPGLPWPNLLYGHGPLTDASSTTDNGSDHAQHP